MNKEGKCEMKHLNDLYEQALKDYEELQQKIDKATEYILKECPHSVVFRNEKISKIYAILTGDNYE